MEFFKVEKDFVRECIELRNNGQSPYYYTKVWQRAEDIVESYDMDMEDGSHFLKVEAHKDAKELKELMEELNPNWRIHVPTVDFDKYNYFTVLEKIRNFYDYFLIQYDYNKVKKLAWLVGEGEKFNNLKHRKFYLRKVFKNILIEEDKYDEKQFKELFYISSW